MADNKENKILYLDIQELKPHPRNNEFYSDIEGDEYECFKQSIQNEGIRTPLHISSDMTIISGHQRYRAAQELGLAKVPVIIKDDIHNEDEKLLQLIINNFGRTKNDPIKQGKMLIEYEKLKGVRKGNNQYSSFGNNSPSSQVDIANELGVDPTTIRNLKRLGNLIPEMQNAISEGRISKTVGYKLLAQLSEDEQKQLYEVLPDEKLTQKRIEGFINEMRGVRFHNTPAQNTIELPAILNNIYCNSNEIKKLFPTKEQQREAILDLCQQMEKNAVNLVGMVIDFKDMADITLRDILPIRSALIHIPSVAQKLEAMLEEKELEL